MDGDVGSGERNREDGLGGSPAVIGGLEPQSFVNIRK